LQIFGAKIMIAAWEPYLSTASWRRIIFGSHST